ncbi:hypothetical protein LTR78_003428 [Recurvomyces mirabilis]|uniref:Uncharacterized protein n=1 Tax=Recurvomyces mirabilis TaxID=574656 RepID=A0AAE1C3P7_9PEZI|nr:hypothetical protein LTR78_003428 [Recurvomyces mirabilis]KAK5154538.1 hypothetical protein LTS14_006675 [Recurvomyces mirabilis]
MGSCGEGKPVSIAVIGAGTIGANHARRLARTTDTVLDCIVDPTTQGQILAAELQVAWYFDATQMLESHERVPSAAIISTPNKMHVPIAMALIPHHIHLLIEKPLCTSVVEGQMLLFEARKNDVVVAVGHHRRHNPRIQAAYHALRNGSIGRILATSGLWVCSKPASYFDGVGAWRGGAQAGIIWINLIHEIDLLQMLVGRIERVYAERAPSLRSDQSSSISPESTEGLALTLRFANGAVGTFLALDNAPSPYFMEAGTGENSNFPYSGQDSYHMFGDVGCMTVPHGKIWRPENAADGRNSKNVLEQLPESNVEENVYDRQLKNFVAAVRGEQIPLCAGEDGLLAVAVCEAIQESLSTLKSVPVPLPTLG